MEQHFQSYETSNDSDVNILESQIRECFGRVAYSHKTHEKSADLYNTSLYRLKLAQIILSAITTGGIIIALFGDGNLSSIIAAIASTMLLGISIYMKSYDLREIEQAHSKTASELWDVRESYLSILIDMKSKNSDLKIIRDKRDILQNRLRTIYENAPRTSKKAYIQAQEALKFKEELTFSDEEIDNLLPSKLKSEQ